jgi:hypothetical protein
MNDKDNSGKVSVEEVMQILFLRYGRQLLDSQLEEIFGTSDTNSGTRDLSLTEFLTSLNQSQARLVACNLSFQIVALAPLKASMTRRCRQAKQLRMKAAAAAPKAGRVAARPGAAAGAAKRAPGRS